MPSIRICEVAPTADGFEAELIFEINGRRSYDIAVRDPFDADTESTLEWYFEQWLNCPILDKVQAERARQSVESYGRDLFDQVFRADADGFADYRELRRSLQLADGSVQIEIEGSPEFQGLHWEAMVDEGLSEPLSAIATMVRVNPKKRAANPAVMQGSDVLNLLVVTARPGGNRDVGYRTISRPLIQGIEDSQVPVNVELVRPGTWEALDRQLQERGAGYYHGIHFDLHGSVLTYDQAIALLEDEDHRLSPHTFQRGYGLQALEKFEGAQGFLSFEGDRTGQSILVSADEVARKLMDKQIPLCVLNACQSAKQLRGTAENPAQETSLGAKLLEAGMQAIVAMGYSVTVDAARVMMTTLYGALFQGKDVMEAIRLGRRELLNNKGRTSAWFGEEIELEDWLLPVIYANGQVRLNLRPRSIEDDLDRLEEGLPPCPIKQPEYGFVGRDTDILAIERCLLKPNGNGLLLQGMGGAGKTTLLAHLWEWWHRTGLIEGAFYFGYDRKGYTFPQILSEIGRSLLSDGDWLKFQARPLQTQAQFLRKRLRAVRYALILDNLESVTAAQLSVPNGLPEEERTAIAGWLRSLVGGKTLVVLGSRGREPWLSAVYGSNHLTLAGLDPAARLVLAEKILQRVVGEPQTIAAVKGDGDFTKLMKLLAGYPLAMEVVLGNLGRLSPGEVLAGLDGADVDLDRPDAQDKTESILRCIDFSFCGLSEDAQGLLVCLALFSGFIDRADLENYAKQLESVPGLRDRLGTQGQGALGEQLAGAVQEAVDWGLLSPISPEMPRLLSIQPTLPFFLRSKLAGWEEAEREGLRSAFKQHYIGLAGSYRNLQKSKKSNEKQLGQFFVSQEYENLYAALQISLEQSDTATIYFCLFQHLYNNQRFSEALALSEAAYEAQQNYPEDARIRFEENISLTLHRLAVCALMLKDYERARAAYLECLEVGKSLTSVSEQQRASNIASGYHQLGRVAQELREYEEARRNYQQALEIFIEFGDRYEQAGTYHQLGMVAQALREYEEARRNYQQALEIKIEFGDRYEQAGTYHQLGIVAQELREYEEARRNYQQALEIFIEFGDRYSQASTYHQLGIVAQALREYEEARRNYQQALEIYIEFGDRYEQAGTYHQLGIVAQELREYEEARRNYQQALEIKIEFGDRYEQAGTYHQLGIVAQALREYEEARRNYQQALEIYIEFGDRYSQASTLNQLGLVAQYTENFKEALNYFLQALEIFIQFEDNHNGAIVCRNLGKLYNQTQDETLLTTAANHLNTTPDALRQLFTQTDN